MRKLPTNAVDVIKRAERLLKQKGFVKYAYSRGGGGYCTIGALTAAATGDPYAITYKAGRPLQTAIKWVANVIRREESVSPKDEPKEVIIYKNDRYSTTAHDMLDILEKARKARK